MASTRRSIWTSANIVTCVRVALVPFWLFFAEAVGKPSDGLSLSMGAFAVFLVYCVIALTDKLDGYLARSRNEVTTFGKFLDPIADKLAVIVALCYLLETGEVGSWCLLIVVAREFLVSGLRMVVASKGTVIAASGLGKAKTATTMGSICGLLLCMSLPAGIAWNLLHTVSFVLLIVAMVLTAWSGVDYFVKSWAAITEDGD